MVLTGVVNQGDATADFRFPSPGILLPDTKDYQTRRHATFLWPDIQQIACRIQLPPGWEASRLPAPLTYRSPNATFRAAWTADKETLSADATVTLDKPLFQPNEMKTLGDTIGNFQSWAAKSITLAPAKGVSPVAAAPKTDTQLAEGLPTMPTGEGQLNLIDSEFPDDGNLAARRAALERVPLLFPSDKKAIVEASVRIAILDFDNQKWTEVVSRLQPIVDANRAALDPGTIAWADYVRAGALLGQGKKDEARTLFQSIAENAAVGSGRRGWATYKTASILSETAPAAALDFADKGLGLDSSAAPLLYGLYGTIAINNGAADRLKDRLTKLIASKPENLESILLETSNASQNLIQAGHKKEGLDLLGLLESLSDPAATGDAFARALKKVRADSESLATHAKLQQDLRQALTEFPDIAALEKKQPAFSSVSDARKSLEQHENNSEPDEALGCALRLALGYPADADFPKRLWDCAKYSEWGMRNAPAPFKEPFFFRLEKLADSLSPTVDPYVDLKLLHARVLENKGQRADADKIYESLKKQADLADGFQGPIALRSGTNWEALGDYAKALACYQGAEACADSQSKAQEALLRAAFIQFDNGNTTESLRLVGLLKDAAAKNKIKAGEQVCDVVVLSKGPSDATAFWKNWPAWWPQWQKIETTAGLAPLKESKVVPIIPSLTSLGQSLGVAKRDKDIPQFFTLMRQLAYAARFYPNGAKELVGLCSTAEEVLPDHANDFRLMALAILDPLPTPEPADRRYRILNLLINDVDSDQSDKALALMTREWKPELEDASPTSQAIHRVWGIAAVRKHQDLDKVREVLEKDIHSSPEANMTSSAGVLVDVYLALGRQPDAERLLQAELASPAVAASPASQKELRTRLENLQNTSLASKQLADGVAAWLKDHKPSWWDYAEPKSPADPRLARLDQILDHPNGEFQPAEWVKAGLMAPSVPSLSPDTQQQAILKGFSQLLDATKSQTDADALATSILGNPSFPKTLKTSFLYSFLIDGYSHQQAAASFETFKKDPLYDTLTAEQKTFIERLAPLVRIDHTSSADLVGFIQKLAQHPMDSLDLDLVQDALSYILQSLDLDAAQTVYQAAAGYTLAPDAGKTRPELQLILLKQINRAKPLKPIVEALRKECLSHYKPETIEKPATFDQRRDLANFGDLSDEEATRFRLYLIKTHQEPIDLEFWAEFMRELPHDATRYDLVLSLLKAGLASTTEDYLKSSLVFYGSDAIDLDEPALRQRLLDIVKPCRDPVAFPQTAEYIRLLDATLALRLGNPINLEADLSGYSSADNASLANRAKIRAYLQAGNRAKLKTTLSALPADQMMSSMLAEEILPALQAAGMKDEAALTHDALAHSLYLDVLKTWFAPEGDNLDSVETDLYGLNTTQDIPASFSSFIETRVLRPRPRLRYQLSKAYVEKDWAAAVSAGNAYIQAYPAYYPAYWFLGRSLAELGKKEEAVKALTVYCRYSRDEVSYPEAKALLAKLTGAAK